MNQLAKKIVKILRNAGHEAYFAGGCVRDLLLGIDPKDYDIATSAHPDAIVALFRRTRPVGHHFGVILVRLGGHDFEVATFRADGPYLDSRRPTHVTFTTAEEDVKRRDFTVNGLLFDPQTDQVLDLVGGREDLERRVIRAIGNPEQRFKEDALRLLRAVRFAVTYDFALDDATFGAMQTTAPLIANVSRERVSDEMRRILASPHAARGITLLDESTLLPVVYPELDPQLLPLIAGRLEHLPGDNALLALACLLLGSVASAEVDAFRQKNRLSRADGSTLTALLDHHGDFERYPSLARHARIRLIREPWARDAIGLLRADLRARKLPEIPHHRAAHELAHLSAEELRPRRLIDGADLQRLGIPPGPLYRTVLTAIEDAQLDQRIRDHDEALTLIASLTSGEHNT